MGEDGGSEEERGWNERGKVSSARVYGGAASLRLTPVWLRPNSITPVST